MITYSRKVNPPFYPVNKVGEIEAKNQEVPGKWGNVKQHCVAIQ